MTLTLPQITRACASDPLLFGRVVLGGTRWSRQNEIRLSVEHNRRTVAYSANGVGKTWEMAATACEFLVMNPGARVFFIGPSFDQVRDGVWSELRKCWNTANRRGFRLSQDEPGDRRWRIDEGWDASIVAVSNISAAHGRRGDVVLVVIDEGQGVESLELMDALDSLVQDPRSRMLAGGNPLEPQGFLHDIAEGNASKHWHRIRIDGFEHPNIRTGKIVIPGSITRLWCHEKSDLWGKEDPRYMARVRGRFPPAGAWQLIPLALLEQCEAITPDVTELKRAGLDVARNPGSGDKNVICVLDEHRTVTELKGWHSDDTMAVAEVAVDTMERHKIEPRRFGVDVTGIGAGVVDRCRQRGYHVIAVDFGSSARGHWREVIGKDANHDMLKPELHDALRALLRRKLLSVPRRWRHLWDDLRELQFTFRHGRMVIEDKESFRKRVGRSPDFSDALVVALATTGAKPRVI